MGIIHHHSLHRTLLSPVVSDGMEFFWDFTKPVGLTDVSNQNTVDTSGGYDSFTRAFDFSGKGLHLTVPNKTQAGRYNPLGQCDFLGNQYFNRVTAAPKLQSYFIVFDAGIVTTTSAPNCIGEFGLYPGADNNTIPGYLLLGPVTSTITGETFTYYHRHLAESAMGFGGDFSGLVTYGLTVREDGTNANGIGHFASRNGVKLAQLNTTSNSFAGFINVQLGRRSISATNYFTGSIKKVVGYSQRKTEAQHTEIFNLLNS